jgi:hypothetical protein
MIGFSICHNADQPANRSTDRSSLLAGQLSVRRGKAQPTLTPSWRTP